LPFFFLRDIYLIPVYHSSRTCCRLARREVM